MAKRSQLLVTLVFANAGGVCGCNDSPADAPHIDSMRPDAATAGQASPVTIHGERFFVWVGPDMRKAGGKFVDSHFAGRLGLHALWDVTFVDSQTLRATVPAMMPVGVWDLEIALPDGQRAALANAFEILAAAATEGGPNPGDARSPGDSAAGDPGPPGAPIATLNDTFDDGSIGPDWQVSTTSGCTVVENSGRILIATDGSAVSRCALTTTNPFDLTGDAATIHIPEITSFHPELWFFLKVTANSDDNMDFGFQNDQMWARMYVAGSRVFEEPTGYRPRPNYWRIREGSGNIFFETSVDNTIWSLNSVTGVGFPVTRVYISFGAQTSGPMPGGVNISTLEFSP